MVYPPGFIADCLETLDELGNEGLAQWEEAGGQANGYFVATCLNDHSVWLQALEQIVRREAAGWVAPQSEKQSLLVEFQLRPSQP